MAKKSRTPWDKSNPRKRAGKSSKHLTSAEKTKAKTSAKRAGRPYPNLVDNMRVAAKKTAKKSTKKSVKKSSKTSTKAAGRKQVRRKKTATKKKTASKKKSAKKKPVEKDPRGGLTTAGRAAFAKKQGAHLKPGVRKPDSKMSLMEMRRKGSWAVRFFGRSKLPPLVDASNRPTRHALSAHAWGEPVPKTIAAARRIAAKGRRLLERYQHLRYKS